MAGARPGQITVCPPSVRPAHPRDPDAPFALLFLLLLAGLTGLPLLAFRATGAMGQLLAIHFGVILALFLLLPYSKFIHGIYRSLALLRWAKERDQDAAVPSRPEQRRRSLRICGSP